VLNNEQTIFIYADTDSGGK